MLLTPKRIAIIKATVPVIQSYGNEITTVFYKNMLSENPQLNSIFNAANQVHQHQPRALANALYAYAANIDDLGNLAPAVELICHKHASLYVQPEQYEIVGNYLLQAMSIVLKDAFTDEVRDAWASAYWQLANVLINREAQMYKEWEGWTEWRDFRIIKKVAESDNITSFCFAPVDGKPLPIFSPGQYVSIQLNVPALKHRQSRQYSLSDAANADYYRISVKRHGDINMNNRKESTHPGYVSNLLHDSFNEGDVVQLSHPSGNFFLNMGSETAPVVLISAGVGVTPLMSMLNTLVKSNSSRPVCWIHGTRGRDVQPFRDHIRSISKTRENVKTIIFNKTPTESDEPGIDFRFHGRVDLGKLDKRSDLFLENPETEYYICGPSIFMTDTEKALRSYGVDRKRIKFELFGTGGVPCA